ncbi:MAG: ribose-5-phosphate isomerase RpiA, partial [Chloroflexota bacterium]
MINLKQQAAMRALDYVQNGMVLGLGTGSTTAYFVDFLGEHLASGALNNIKGVPTSVTTAEQAKKWGIPLVNLSQYPKLDLAIDGADEVDPTLNLIKGLGRAMLREKIVAMHAEHFIVVVDHSKIVPKLGDLVPLPVELITFEAESHIQWLNTLGCNAELWLEEDGSPVITDNGNYLARCWFDNGITDASSLAQTLAMRPG